MGISMSDSENTNKLYIYISFFLGQGVILIPPLYYLNIKKKPILKSLRINKISFEIFKHTFILSVGIILIFDVLENIIDKLFPTPDYIIDLGSIMQPDSILGYLFLFLAVVVIAPIGEEILFRGFLQRFLEKHWKDITKAVLVTSLFFALIHFNPYWTIQIYILGIFLGYLSWKTKSVIPSILLHGLNNGTAFILSVFDKTLVVYNFSEIIIFSIIVPVGFYATYKGIQGLNNSVI